MEVHMPGNIPMYDDLQGYKNLLRIPKQILAASVTVAEIEFDEVKAGRIWHVQRVVTENETNSATSVRILIRGGGQDMVYSYQASPVADTPYWENDVVPITEGQRLVIRWVGATLNDVIKAWLFGYELRQAENAAVR